MGNLWIILKPNLIYVFLGILALNIGILDYVTFFTPPKSYRQVINLTTPGSTTTTTSVTTPSGETTQVAAVPNSADLCPNACLTAINTATASLKLTQTVVNNNTTQSAPASSAPQEYFIPFGAGSAASQGSYSTVQSLQAYVNTNLYPNIATVTFEVSATIPNGNQSISLQLYDATDGYAIPNSQVNMSGGTPQLLISPNLTLPAGNKLYQVQVNTQLNSAITIDQARLHITTN